MTGKMTEPLTRANEAFMLHCSVCETCGPKPGALCREGMELQRAFYAVIQKEARKLPLRSKAEQIARQATQELKAEKAQI